MSNTNAFPTARIHDLGELTVINDDHGRVHHRFAAVLVFDGQEEAAACIRAGTVRLVPAQDLNPEICEYMKNHRGNANG